MDGKHLLFAANSGSWRKVPEPELNTLFFLPKSVIDHSNSPRVTRRQREAKGFLNRTCSPWRRTWQGRTPRKLRAGGGRSSSLEPPPSSGPSLTAQMQGARTLGLPPSCRVPCCLGSGQPAPWSGHQRSCRRAPGSPAHPNLLPPGAHTVPH